VKSEGHTDSKVVEEAEAELETAKRILEEANSERKRALKDLAKSAALLASITSARATTKVATGDVRKLGREQAIQVLRSALCLWGGSGGLGAWAPGR